ncbi:STAS domain-containing protein [Streptomyces sp. NPDC053493]|uniref:STAS domain-containing protein n=1 Tax=Streptomyces sp. NPDC053493 TaxID=3365705 RepID=UPI0037CD3B05
MFSVEVRQEARGTVMALRGELDFDSAVQLDEAGHGVLEPGRRKEPVVVDMAGLTFCDSSGISALLRLYQQLSTQERRLLLAAVPRTVLRLFTLTGLDQIFPVHPDAHAALAGGPPGPHPATGSAPSAQQNEKETA